MLPQYILFAVIIVYAVLLFFGKWRFEVNALVALMLLVIAGVVPANEAFLGFGHPAVITVAAILVMSRALIDAGVVSAASGWLFKLKGKVSLSILAVSGLVAVVSVFINNVGAVALSLPIGIKLARRNNLPPSVFLIPIAFGSLLGGVVTKISSPSNIIVGLVRGDMVGAPFRIFDFAPVGVAIMIAGLIFVSFIGWRLVPRRKEESTEKFDIKDYLTELRVTANSKLKDKSIRELEGAVGEYLPVIGLVRDEHHTVSPSYLETFKEGDILVVRASPEALETLTKEMGFELVGSREIDHGKSIKQDEIEVAEAVIAPESLLIGKTTTELNLRWRYGVNLLAVSRQDEKLAERLDKIRFRAGDIVLIQGASGTLGEFLSTAGCLPLAEREIKVGKKGKALAAALIFFGSIILAITGLAPVQIALALGAVLMVLGGFISARKIYSSINWPVIVLLGAMIPVGAALQTTGAARTIAELFFNLSGILTPAAFVTGILVFTMLFSNFETNVTAAVLMAPIAFNMAQVLGVSPDPLLMAVAVGAALPFLTPVGHQSSMLVFEPGGYKFGDFWKIGLPLSVIVVLVAVPAILYFWPL